MSEKKVIGRNVAIALGIICIIVLVGLVGAIANYTMIINNKDTGYQNYVSTHSHTNSEYDSLLFNYNNYVANHHHTDEEYDVVTAPKLIKVNLRASDDRPLFQAPRLHVYGYMCNVGTNIAYNSKLHVVAYQSGGVVAIDTYITLGAIYGESWTSVDTNVFYSGDALTSWSITPQWTTTP